MKAHAESEIYSMGTTRKANEAELLEMAAQSTMDIGYFFSL